MSELSSRILYCDANCVVVNKIAGEAVEGAGKGMVDLPQSLSAMLGDKATAVHRLDVPVSGCAAFARSESALRFLNNAFSNNAVQKHYWAIVEMPKNNTFPDTGEYTELTHWIQFDPKRNKSIAQDQSGPGRKKAVLRCRITGRGQHYLFFEIELITGRHHRIRAQFERMGLHIKGDLKYGAKRSEQNGGIRLHARSLSFPDPANDSKIITVQAEPPINDNLWQAFQDAVISS
ncbi:MAG: RNA pseudouridine synthase [Treponema sp.]|jgi:23S rRNA pseudouridine1911/1915/1917 synthase|nr:RNA pseudouridine synthase [Treponema sp.]